ncbi:MAG: hypothetical protein KJO07_20535 [Deltaproteobacteria bacterium]|nr:hypothetical protein [Deltaproteobacteria bacterium]
MSEHSGNKHRHDIGHPDHGAEATEQVTRGIQFALGVAIVGTIGLIVYLAAVSVG